MKKQLNRHSKVSLGSKAARISIDLDAVKSAISSRDLSAYLAPFGVEYILFAEPQGYWQYKFKYFTKDNSFVLWKYPEGYRKIKIDKSSVGKQRQAFDALLDKAVLPDGTGFLQEFILAKFSKDQNVDCGPVSCTITEEREEPKEKESVKDLNVTTDLPKEEEATQLDEKIKLSGSAFVFGDSQVQSSNGLGGTVQAKFGGERYGLHKKSAEYFIKGAAGWSKIEPHLKAGPKTIHIFLGGNAVDGKEVQLISDIQSITPNSSIMWWGPAHPGLNGTLYSKNKKSWTALLKDRENKNKLLGDSIGNIPGVTHINPFTRIPEFKDFHNCTGGKCDGIHPKGKYAEFLVNAVLT